MQGGQIGACVAAFLGGLWGLFGSWSGLPWGFPPDSPPAYENSLFWLSLCNRFLALLANFRFKGILRGFIWVYRCKMYICSVAAFVGLVGLYACRVRRLRTEKRIAAHFLGFIGSVGFLGCFALAVALLWLVLCLSLGLLCSCCLWVSLGLWVVLLVAFFPFG